MVVLIMNLTKEEEQIILEHRKKQKESEIQKTGILKENLFIFEGALSSCLNGKWLFGLVEKDQIIKNFKSGFKLIVKAGSIFDCYIDNGHEQWYDREYGLEGLPESWANSHLKNIKAVK